LVTYPLDHCASSNRKLLYDANHVFAVLLVENKIKIKMCISGLNLCVPSAILKLLKAYATISLSGQSNLAQRYL
jgi:hypothetical protein